MNIVSRLWGRRETAVSPPYHHKDHQLYKKIIDQFVKKLNKNLDKISYGFYYFNRVCNFLERPFPEEL